LISKSFSPSKQWITIWRGAPSAAIVDSTAQRGALRKARTYSIRTPPSVMHG
jgi:hypothetical protein